MGFFGIKIMRSFLFFTCLLTTILVWSQDEEREKLNTSQWGSYAYKAVVRETSGEDSENKKLAEEFKTFWQSDNMSDREKQAFSYALYYMSESKFRPIPDYARLMKLTMSAHERGMSSVDIDTLFYTVEKVVQNYSKEQAEDFFSTTIAFLEDSVLKKGLNSYYAQGGSFKIKYIEESESQEDVDFADMYMQQAEEEADDEGSDDGWGSDDDSGDDDGWGDSDDGWGDSDDGWDSWDDSGDDSWGTTEPEPEEDNGKSSNEEYSDEALEMMFTPDPLPPVDGAVIELKNTDILLVTPHDSLSIKNTNASYMIKKQILVGDTGTVDWSTAGLDNVKAIFPGYALSTMSSQIEVEGATLEYPERLEEPVEGIFKFQSRRADNPEDKRFPEFMSYKSDVNIKGIGENVEYHGGFTLRGQRIFSSSVSEGYSTISVKYNDKPKFNARARFFKLGDSLITSSPVEVKLYQGKDSIYHPGVRLKYDQKNNDLRLYKKGTGFESTPFVNTYHALDMDVDAIYWTLSDSVIHFTQVNAKHEVPAFFKSKEIFERSEFIQLKGIYSFHPLQMSANYAMSRNISSFYADDLADHYDLKKNQVRSAMKGLMTQGYIDYDPKTGYVELKEKAEHSVLANRGKIDFDVIDIKSLDPGGYNATMKLDSNMLVIDGVDRVSLSDSLNVYFVPKDRQVKVLKNRSIQFDGEVMTNNYRFSGQDFTFDYLDFSIDLKQIDSIKFSMEVRDSVTGEVKGRKTLQNKLSYSAGVLTIDKANNKSGRENNPKYPHFDANKGASVLFNSKEILNGAYDETVRYKIPPFDVDSLSGNQKGAASFDGTFASGGIFPEFDEKLEVMEDFSFGFTHKVPDEGYKLYDGEAVFYGTISLDNQGIRGNGRIEYLNTVVESNDFVFYLDSVKALASHSKTVAGTNPSLPEKIVFPEVEVNGPEMLWYPSKDRMNFMSYSEPFDLFGGKAILNGTATVTSKGMLGDGMIESEGALTISSEIEMGQNKFVARNSQFEILSETPAKPAMKSDMVKVDVDFNLGRARFSPEKEGVASNEFPFLQYKSSLDKGIWYIDEHKVLMEMPEGGNISRSYFYSTREEQDSLVFNAEKAVYYMDSLSLKVSGVPYIHVQDAKIIPDENKVSIKENAKIERLNHCELLIDTTNEYHYLYDGHIDIKGRYKFDGDATYAYINADKDTMTIEFNRFDYVEQEVSKGKTERHTVSSGTISEADSFVIAPRMFFKGKATMYAEQKPLKFEGYVQLDLHGEVSATQWMPYTTEGEEGTVTVNLEGQTGENGKPFISGVYYSQIRKNYYSIFLDQPNAASDTEVLKATGVLSYNFDDAVFSVGKREKIEGETTQGNIFSYHEEDELFEFHGAFKLLEKDNEDRLGMKLPFACYGVNNLLDSTWTVKGLAMLQFDIPGSFYKEIGEDLRDNGQIMAKEHAMGEPSDMLFNNIGILTEDKSVADYMENAQLKAPPLSEADNFFKDGLVLHELELEFHKETGTWRSKGLLKISNSGKEEVNYQAEGYLEITKHPAGDRLDLYLELNQNCWYYFNYQDNSLVIRSSNDEFNDEVESKSDRDKHLLSEAYFFALASPGDHKHFINRFEERYLDGDGNTFFSGMTPMEEESDRQAQPADDPMDDPYFDEDSTQENEEGGDPMDDPYFDDEESDSSDDNELDDPYFDDEGEEENDKDTGEENPEKKKEDNIGEENPEKEKKKEDNIGEESINKEEPAAEDSP